MFSYRSASDAVATIAAANYFADVVYDLYVNDLLYIKGSDAVGMYVVSAIDRAAGTISLTAASLTGVVNTANIADLAVTTGKLADGAVTNLKVDAAAAIAFSKLEVMTSGNILVGSAGNVATEVTMSGDATIIASGALTIANSAITNAKVSASAAIDFSKLAALPSAEILVGSAGNVATAVAMSGDVAISNAGVTTIQAGAVDSAMINANVLRYAAVSMSAVEFAGAYAAPKLLVAAGGANTLLSLEGAYALMTYATTQWANGGVAHIQYDSTANGAGIIASTTHAAANFFDAASTALYFNPGVVKQPFTTCVNKGLYFSNVTGAFDTGDSPFVVHIWYRQIPTV
jgi:hypothetical protein